MRDEPAFRGGVSAGGRTAARAGVVLTWIPAMAEANAGCKHCSVFTFEARRAETFKLAPGISAHGPQLDEDENPDFSGI